MNAGTVPSNFSRAPDKAEMNNITTKRLHDHQGFWNSLDTLLESSEIVIDRPKGSRHPRFQDFVYPLDYGYLANTASMDGGGIDIWIGTREPKSLDAILCVVDMWKRDSEIKLLYGCTPKEQQMLYALNNEEGMHALLIQRGNYPQ